MKFDIREDPSLIGSKRKITVGGDVVTRVIAADDQAGYVTRHATDANGMAYMIDGEVVLETIYGKVTIGPPTLR